MGGVKLKHGLVETLLFFLLGGKVKMVSQKSVLMKIGEVGNVSYPYQIIIAFSIAENLFSSKP